MENYTTWFMGFVGFCGALYTIVKIYDRFITEPRREIYNRNDELRKQQIETQKENTDAINSLIGEIKVLTLKFSNQQELIEDIREEQHNHSKRIGKLENKVAVLTQNTEK